MPMRVFSWNGMFSGICFRGGLGCLWGRSFFATRIDAKELFWAGGTQNGNAWISRNAIVRYWDYRQFRIPLLFDADFDADKDSHRIAALRYPFPGTQLQCRPFGCHAFTALRKGMAPSLTPPASRLLPLIDSIDYASSVFATYAS